MKWVRGEGIGHGGFASVSKAKIISEIDENNNIPPIVALKSCSSLFSGPLTKEKEILDKIGICPQIISCFGDEISLEGGTELYNLLLEFAPGGTLADLAKTHGGRLPELLLRRHTRTILQGLSAIHSRGFVHCDIKPQNILVFSPGEVKIADFGAAVERDQGGEQKKHSMRGTPRYIAPESIKDDRYEPPCDVWALGCLVAELASGRAVWDYNSAESSVWAMLLRIAGDGEEAEIPAELSEEGRDFVSKCLVKDPKRRWTASMLLDHAFVNNSNGNSNDLEPEKNKWKSCFAALLSGALEVVRNLLAEDTLDSSSFVGFFIYNYFP